MKAYKLSDLGTIITGNTPSTKVKEYYDSNDIKFIKPNDVPNSKKIYQEQSSNYISEKARGKARLVPINSVLVTCIGIIGKVSVTKEEVAFNQQINAIVPNKKVLPEYLALKLKYKRNNLEQLSNKSVVSNINKTNFSKFEIRIPPIKEQEKFLEIIKKSITIIEKRQQQIEALSTLKQSIFFNMFDGGNKVKKVKVNEVINSITAGLSTGGETREREFGELGVLTTSAVTYGIFDSKAYKVPSEDKIAGKNLVFPTKSSILVSRMNTKELVGAACIVEDNYNELFIPDRIWKLEPNTNLINPYYLISVIQSNLFRVQIDRISTGTSGSMQNISQKNFKDLEIPYPNLELQNKYAKKVSAINKKTVMLKGSLENFQSLYESLLNKAFNGELFKEDIKV